MQSKAMIKRLKRLEQKALKVKPLYIFFSEPSKAELAKLPKGAKVIVFIGEDELED
jgi:hypothetical protein